MSEEEKPKPERRCETCRFWNGVGDSGECRRYPPAPNHAYQMVLGLLGILDRHQTDPAGETCGNYIGTFPGTFNDHWCGEWKAKGLPLEDQAELVRLRAWRRDRDWEAFRKCLSVRATKALDKLLIQDFEKLLATNPDDLMPHCGMTGLVDIARLLRAAGFGPLESGWPRDAD